MWSQCGLFNIEIPPEFFVQYGLNVVSVWFHCWVSTRICCPVWSLRLKLVWSQCGFTLLSLHRIFCPVWSQLHQRQQVRCRGSEFFSNLLWKLTFLFSLLNFVGYFMSFLNLIICQLSNCRGNLLVEMIGLTSCHPDSAATSSTYVVTTTATTAISATTATTASTAATSAVQPLKEPNWCPDQLNLRSYRWPQQIHQSYRLARFYKFSRQKCRIYEFPG